jgi:hypothetical protein
MISGWRTLYLEEGKGALQAVKPVILDIRVLDRSLVNEFPGQLKTSFELRTSFSSVHGADTMSRRCFNPEERHEIGAR